MNKEYEDQLEKCTRILSKSWIEAMGCNGYLQVAGHLENILLRQADLTEELRLANAALDGDKELVEALERIADIDKCKGLDSKEIASRFYKIAIDTLKKYKEKP